MGRRWNSTHNVKVEGIVDQISQLTLLETADLVSSLKVSFRRLAEEPWIQGEDVTARC